MKHAIHYDADDIKSILAERHGVDPKNVIRNQYSYTVVLEKEVKDDEDACGASQIVLKLIEGPGNVTNVSARIVKS